MKKYKDRNYVGVSAGAYGWVPVDAQNDSFAVGYLIQSTGSGQVQGNIEGTHDNVLVGSGSAKSGVLVTAIASASAGGGNFGVIPHPCAALRFRVISVSGSSNITFSLLQAGPAAN
jgi:hypothetical protein